MMLFELLGIDKYTIGAYAGVALTSVKFAVIAFSRSLTLIEPRPSGGTTSTVRMFGRWPW